MVDGFHLGLGILNFIVGVLFYFTFIVCIFTEFPKPLSILLIGLTIISFLIALWSFEKAFDDKKEVRNGKSYHKKSH